MINKDVVKETIAKVSAVLLGVVFIFSGLVKAIDPVGGVHKLHDYFIAFGWEWLTPFELFFSFSLSAVEFTLGLCLLLGAYRRYSSFLLFLLMLFMTPFTLYLAIKNPVSDCGCFGDALIITNWETFFKNVVLLIAASCAFVYHKRIYAVYTIKAYWFVPTFAYLFINIFAYVNYSKLPLIDFRPYKIGANIPALMQVPEGAPLPEEIYSFVLEKDGIKKTFSLDNYPQDDTTWTFVEQKVEVVKKGYVPPITDFSVVNEEGDDITDQILQDTIGVFLLISPSLVDADDSDIERLNSLYDFALERNYKFYCLTGASSDEITTWIDNTGAEYPFFFTDPITLKTMIRSNPGLILLKEGTILGKWSHQQLPKEADLPRLIGSKLKQGAVIKQEDDRIMTNLLSFTLPLLLVWLYDYFKNRRKKQN